MVQTTWNNRFLAVLIAIIILFVIIVGWIILRENGVTDAAAVSPVSAPTIVTVPHKPHVDADYAPSRAPESAKQMYMHIQETDETRHIPPAHSTDQNYNTGYEWATEQKITHRDQCNMLNPDYIDGCYAYLEVKNYVNQTDKTMEVPKY